MNTTTWANLSLDGKKCGIFGCGIEPTCKCTECNMFYCYDHIKIHLHSVKQKIRKVIPKKLSNKN